MLKTPNVPVPEAASDPDVQLMLRLRAGDAGAFRELFEKHSRAIVNFAYNFVGSRPRAEELAQDVFLQVYRAAARYEPNAKFTTWLYRIATNACLNEVRRPERRYRTRSLERETDDSRDRTEIFLPDPTALPGESALAGRELEAKIREVLGTLPENQRAALVLSRVDGLSYREVADALECSESAVKSLVFRATATLRRELEEYL
ncbi:MAG: sigma-70 family RNA polymerase sigma factor [Deltaproteobacteria bacterium]|nr:sigma-70 family RNA polymerase sigma factor [Deltaproteobacteria bacterium]